MPAPVVVALTNDYVASVTAHLQGRLGLKYDVLTIEAVRAALEAAAGLVVPDGERPRG